MNYVKIMSFGKLADKSKMVDPLTYCAVSGMDSMFNHTAGSRINKDSSQCQNFMSDYCANNWNEVCENASRDSTLGIPNMVGGVNNCNSNSNCYVTGNMGQLTQGEILIRNTAAKKYLKDGIQSCYFKYEPFDPQTSTSPMIRVWKTNDCSTQYSGPCVLEYEVDPKVIDADPVMNKLLENPLIGLDILINIYNTAMKYGKFNQLQGTRLYNLFLSPVFQQYVRGSFCRAQMTGVLQ